MGRLESDSTTLSVQLQVHFSEKLSLYDSFCHKDDTRKLSRREAHDAQNLDLLRGTFVDSDLVSPCVAIPVVRLQGREDQ